MIMPNRGWNSPSDDDEHDPPDAAPGDGWCSPSDDNEHDPPPGDYEHVYIKYGDKAWMRVGCRNIIIGIVSSWIALVAVCNSSVFAPKKEESDPSAQVADPDQWQALPPPVLSPTAMRIAELDRAITLHPADLSLREQLCTLLSEQGDFLRAMREADVIHRIQPSHEAAARAGRERVRHIERYPDDWETLAIHAQRAVEFYTEALQLLAEEQASHASPPTPIYLSDQGEIYKHNKGMAYYYLFQNESDPEKRREYAQAAIEDLLPFARANGNDIESARILAMLFRYMKDETQAQEWEGIYKGRIDMMDPYGRASERDY